MTKTTMKALLTEDFPCFYFSCKANAKTRHGPHSSKLVVICVVLSLLVLFHVLFVCKCVLYYCHRVTPQMQLIYISYYIKVRFGPKVKSGTYRILLHVGPTQNCHFVLLFSLQWYTSVQVIWFCEIFCRNFRHSCVWHAVFYCAVGKKYCRLEGRCL
jgi:hypothetical protein